MASRKNMFYGIKEVLSDIQTESDSSETDDSEDTFSEEEDPLLDNYTVDDTNYDESVEVLGAKQKRPSSLPSGKTKKQRTSSPGSQATKSPRSSSRCERPSTSNVGTRSLRSSATKKASRDQLAAKNLGELMQAAGGEEQIWHDDLDKDKQPRLPFFKPRRSPGPQFIPTAVYSPLQLFQMFMSTSVVKTIVDNTNSFARKRAQAGKKFNWTPLTTEEFYSYLGLVIYMGLVVLKRFSDYWSEQAVYGLRFPRSVMSRNRFLAITWNLHLCDPEKDVQNQQKKGTQEYDGLFKIKPLYTDILTACQNYLHPHREVFIDERMTASKAYIGIKQHEKHKRTKWGYKLFVLADSATGYTWNFFVYDGQNKFQTGKGLGYNAVTELIRHSLLGSGYKLFMDSFYTSPNLLSDLYAAKTLACGILHPRGQAFPCSLGHNMPRNAPRGTIRWHRQGELLFVKWMDTHEVVMCSTMHKVYSGDRVSRSNKNGRGVMRVRQGPIPDAVREYKKNMNGLNLSDSFFGCYNALHNTKKWYKTFFYHLIDIAVENSFILHKEMAKLNNQNMLTQKQFREILACELFKVFKTPAEVPEPTPRDTCYPGFYSVDPSIGRRVCEMCKRKGKKVKTPAFCTKCRVSLCLMPKRNCFLQWHEEGLQDEFL